MEFRHRNLKLGKRTSDFMELATIVAGAGLGLGLTSLFPQSGADAAHRAEDSSVRVRALGRNIVVEPERRLDASEGSHVGHEAPSSPGGRRAAAGPLGN